MTRPADKVTLYEVSTMRSGVEIVSSPGWEETDKTYRLMAPGERSARVVRKTDVDPDSTAYRPGWGPYFTSPERAISAHVRRALRVRDGARENLRIAEENLEHLRHEWPELYNAVVLEPTR